MIPRLHARRDVEVNGTVSRSLTGGGIRARLRTRISTGVERRIQGSLMGSNRFRVDMPRYVDLYLQGRLKLDELVSARIGLDDVNEGFAAMRERSLARSVIVF
jgi:Zn-dependent alcohol dehydrogenase